MADPAAARRPRITPKTPAAISSGSSADVAAVDDRDDQQRDDVVDDDDRQHEGAQAIGEARPDQREHPERERGVGRHRHAPAVRRAAARR